jgi:hypothetical protein
MAGARLALLHRFDGLLRQLIAQLPESSNQ